MADGDALDLIEHALAAHGHLLIAIALAGQQRPKGLGVMLTHGVNLPWRGVGAQQDVGLGREKGVLHVTRRMVRRKVEQLKVGHVVLDLAAAQDLEPQIAEDVIDLAQGLGADVQGAEILWASRQAHVEGVTLQ